MITHRMLITPVAPEYELLDSGQEEKLERFGSILLARPDPQALWEKRLPQSAWNKAQGRYERQGREGAWKLDKDVPEAWNIEFGGLRFILRPTSFKHTGLFPEQLENWSWCEDLISKSGRPISVLNLFGYTGGATLAAAKAGAEVVHVDASKTAVAWARENAALSEVSGSIRWLVDDVSLFVQREIRRKHTYDAIIMDPPAFGHGPKGELWKIEEDLVPLIAQVKQLLSPNPLFFVLSGYAAGYSSLAFAYNLTSLLEQGGTLEHGELTIQEKESERLLPCGIFARWKNN